MSDGARRSQNFTSNGKLSGSELTINPEAPGDQIYPLMMKQW